MNSVPGRKKRATAVFPREEIDERKFFNVCLSLIANRPNIEWAAGVDYFVLNSRWYEDAASMCS